MEGNFQIQQYDYRQYVICGIFSRDEIDSKDVLNSEIETFRNYLLELDRRKFDVEVSKKCISRGRLAILLNNFGKHGEARLFDPDGIILKEFGITQGGKHVYERHLDKMKKSFILQFGNLKQYFIVLLSHFIPCTVKEHECARLIREYVERSGDCIIISYDLDWYETNRDEAMKLLNHEYIHIISPKERQNVIHKDITGFSLEDENVLCHLERNKNSYFDVLSTCDDHDELVWQRPSFINTRRKNAILRPRQPPRESKRKKRGGFKQQNPFNDRFDELL